MANRPVASRWLIALALAVLVAPAYVAAQQPSDYELPRTPDGQPDLQGVWDFRTLTPLQRPADQAEAVLTPEEAAEIEAAAVQRAAEADAPSEVRTEPLPAGGNVGAYNDFWFDRGAGVVDDRRTSLIVDPADGRVPALQPGVPEQGGAANAEDVASARPVRFRVGGIGTDGPEDRGLAERCLLGFNTGPPIVPAGYNQNLQIFQSAGHVAILHEMVHDARIVPLDGRPHLPDGVRQWMGDSRGYWEGDTLVVETANFTDQTASFNPSVVSAMGTGTTLRLTERFTRIDDDTLLYEYTIDDPATFTRPFTVALPMKRGTGMYEYACHEGNYGLMNMLAGARAEEREAAP